LWTWEISHIVIVSERAGLDDEGRQEGDIAHPHRDVCEHIRQTVVERLCFAVHEDREESNKRSDKALGLAALATKRNDSNQEHSP
jgi:hypothetical protein